MARKVAGEALDPHTDLKMPQKKLIKPTCGFCKAEEAFTFRIQVQGGLDGVLVFCSKCGAIHGWSANPEQK